MTYEQFEAVAAELFGIEPGGEARDFAETLEAVGLFYEEVRANDAEFWELAVELTDEFLEPYFEEAEERYEMPIRRAREYEPEEELWDAGTEFEFTATTHGGTPGKGE